MSFWIKEKLILRISGGKRKSFLTQEVVRTKKPARCFNKLESYISVLKKKKKKKNKKKKQKKKKRQKNNNNKRKP